MGRDSAEAMGCARTENTGSMLFSSSTKPTRTSSTWRWLGNASEKTEPTGAVVRAFLGLGGDTFTGFSAG